MDNGKDIVISSGFTSEKSIYIYNMYIFFGKLRYVWKNNMFPNQ